MQRSCIEGTKRTITVAKPTDRFRSRNWFLSSVNRIRLDRVQVDMDGKSLQKGDMVKGGMGARQAGGPPGLHCHGEQRHQHNPCWLEIRLGSSFSTPYFMDHYCKHVM
jgi:hypothetical protein